MKMMTILLLCKKKRKKKTMAMMKVNPARTGLALLILSTRKCSAAK